ncbi:immunity 49 family protein [Streptomyces sp. NPDC047976]|uniref:immunity 49 family protein n=1 Tax=Streptomyces sp. NPDC047976 TaxID=3155746 RepID=UPI00342DAD32
MTATVTRHSFPTEHAAEGLAVLTRSAGRLLGGLEEPPTELGDALRLTLTLAKSHCLLDPMAGELATWEAWVTAMQTGSALFVAATTGEESVTCRIADEDRVLAARGADRQADAGAWLAAFYLAVVCREKARLTALCRIPVSLLRGAGDPYDEYVYAWVDTLQTYWLGGSDLVGKLVAAVDGTDPSVVAIADHEVTAKILYPPMELFHRLVREDHDNFNRALNEALRWHKDYWSDEDRALQASGLVALAPLAMACFAYDAGFPVEVRSEYLPKYLLERAWAGEFPT